MAGDTKSKDSGSKALKPRRPLTAEEKKERARKSIADLARKAGYSVPDDVADGKKGSTAGNGDTAKGDGTVDGAAKAAGEQSDDLVTDAPAKDEGGKVAKSGREKQEAADVEKPKKAKKAAKRPADELVGETDASATGDDKPKKKKMAKVPADESDDVSTDAAEKQTHEAKAGPAIAPQHGKNAQRYSNLLFKLQDLIDEEEHGALDKYGERVFRGAHDAIDFARAKLKNIVRAGEQAVKDEVERELVESDAAEREDSERKAAEREAAEMEAAQKEATENEAAEGKAEEGEVAEQHAVEPEAAQEEASHQVTDELKAVQPDADQQEPAKYHAAADSVTKNDAPADQNTGGDVTNTIHENDAPQAAEAAAEGSGKLSMVLEELRGFAAQINGRETRDQAHHSDANSTGYPAADTSASLYGDAEGQVGVVTGEQDDADNYSTGDAAADAPKALSDSAEGMADGVTNEHDQPRGDLAGEPASVGANVGLGISWESHDEILQAGGGQSGNFDVAPNVPENDQAKDDDGVPGPDESTVTESGS